MPKSTKRAAARRESAQTQVADALRREIFSGELQPGDPITELHLARRHKVSQTTVREALVRLEHAGLVRRIHNIGTFVTQMSPREVQERVRLRVMLEGLAAMEAARLAQPPQMEEMSRHLKAIAEAIAANDYFAAAQADLTFHRGIWRCSGDNTLYQTLDQLTAPLFAFVSMERRRLHERLADAVRAHEPIVDSLHRRDAAGARDAMRVHIETSYAEFLGAAQAYTLAMA